MLPLSVWIISNISSCCGFQKIPTSLSHSCHGDAWKQGEPLALVRRGDLGAHAFAGLTSALETPLPFLTVTVWVDSKQPLRPVRSIRCVFRPGEWRDGLTSESHLRTSSCQSSTIIVPEKEREGLWSRDEHHGAGGELVTVPDWIDHQS